MKLFFGSISHTEGIGTKDELSVYFLLLSCTTDHRTFRALPGICIFTRSLEVIFFKKHFFTLITLKFFHSIASFMVKIVTPSGHAQATIATVVHFQQLSYRNLKFIVS